MVVPGYTYGNSLKKSWNHSIDENDIIYTKRPAHVIIASQAEGYTTVVSLGCAGTVNEVMEGIKKNQFSPL